MDITDDEVNKYINSKTLPKFKIDEYIKIREFNKHFKYVPMSTLNQIQAILHVPHKKEAERAYINLLKLIVKHMPSITVANSIIHKAMKFNMNDNKVFDLMRSHKDKNNLSRATKHMFISSKDIRHAQEAVSNLQHIISIKPTNYLDVGCGTCKSTIILGHELGLKDIDIYATDIESWGGYTKEEKEHLPINFKWIKPDNSLDYDTNKFDLVSAFMVLHHVPNLKLLLREINRILKLNQYFVIREHDTLTNSDKMLSDIEHRIYEVVYRGNYKYNENINYHDKFEWDIILSRYGFELVGNYYDSMSVIYDISATRYIFKVYRKIKDI